MRIKFLSIIVSLFFFSFTIASCLGDNDPVEYTIDDTIWEFAIDTIYGVNYKFTIDQIKGRIFNMDSVPHSADTIINKILVTKLETGLSYVTTGDTLFQRSDSVDLSNTMYEPMKLKVIAIDGSTEREYSVEVRIHQQDPDSLGWRKLTDSFSGGTVADEQKAIFFNEQIRVYDSSSSFYYSSVNDGESWNLNTNVQGLSGDVKLASILNYKDELYVLSATGEVFKSQDGIIWNVSPLSGDVVALISTFPNGIAAVIAVDGVNKFALSDGEATFWEIGTTTPDDFPVDNISSTSFISDTGLLKTLVVGKPDDSAEHTVPWFSFDGKDWADLKTTSTFFLPAMKKPTIMYYADTFYAYGDGFETFYTSREGLVWTEVEKKFMFPEEFTDRDQYSSLVDKDNYIWIVWGGTEQKDEVWKGRLNKLGFKIKK